MNYCLIGHNDHYVLSPLNVRMSRDIIADVVARYERLFSGRNVSYPNGQSAFLFKALHEGYGMAACQSDTTNQTPIIELGAEQFKAADEIEDDYKDPHVSRIIVAEFAQALREK